MLKHLPSRKKYDNGWKTENLYMLLLFFSIISFAFLYYNRAATDWEGPDNFCAVLMQNGKMMYKEFFYYVPPVYILRCLLTWNLFHGEILPIRFLGIFERALLFVILYKILVRWFKPYISYLACVMGFLLYNSLTFNSYGDYTQYAQIFVALAICCVIRFDEKEQQKENRGLLWLALGSFFLIQSVMTKQSIGAAAVVFMFIALIFYVMFKKELLRFWKYLLAVVIGGVVAILPYVVWLGLNGALRDFINQVFLLSLNSKGLASASNTPLETSLPVRVWKTLINKKSICFDLGLFLYFIFYFYSIKEKSKKIFKNLSCVCLVVALVFAADILKINKMLINIASTLKYLIQNNFFVTVIIIAIAFCVGYIVFNKGRQIDSVKKENNLIAVITVGAFLCWIFISCIPIENVGGLLDSFKMSESISGVYELFFHLCNVVIVAELFRRLILKESKYPMIVISYLAALDANAIISLIGGGSATFSANGSLFTVPFAICILCSSSNYSIQMKKWRKSIQSLLVSIVVFFLFVLSTITMAQHFYVPYSWYGWVSEPISDETSYTIDFDRYTGMLVSKKTKITLEEVSKLILENSVSKDEFVFTFPGGKIYNLLTERYEMPTKVVYYMFDVCPDKYAIADVKILKNNLPSIIVWKDLDESVWETFEEQYRNGEKLGQREIKRWFDSVKDTEYTLVGQIYNESVYVINDGREIKYTAFYSEEEMYSSLDEVYDNINKSNAFFRIAETFAGYIGINEQWIYGAILLFSFFIYILLSRHLNDWSFPLLGFVVLTGMALHVSCVYFFVMLVPLLLWIFNGKRNLCGYVVYGLTFVALIVLLFQWCSVWKVLKFVFYIFAILVVLVSLFEVFFSGRTEQKNRGNVANV